MVDVDLLSVEDRVRLLVNAIADDRDPPPVVKLFTPDASATWLLSECDPDDPDRLFGLCDAGIGCPELGYVSLREIAAVKGRLGMPVERDEHFIAEKPLSAYADEARANGRILA